MSDDEKTDPGFLGEDPRDELEPEIRESSDLLLAFLDTMERQRRAGECLAWKIQTNPRKPACTLAVLTEHGMIEGSGETFKQAHRKLVDAMIERAGSVGSS